jgi:chloramphenicol 3-O-phosphotransferase
VIVELTLAGGEPELGPWRVVGFEHFVALVLGAASASARRPLIVAIDGRSSSGKTTLASRLQAEVDDAMTVHTDDIAWWHSRFDWTRLLAEGVLAPLRGRTSVRFRPPAWDDRGRPGAVEVSADARLVIVEGVGAGRRETAHLVDGIVWVQADVNEIEGRHAARIAVGEAERDGVAKWMAEEFPFVAEQRPWERAFSIVAGSSELCHDPATEVVLGWPPRA